MADKRIQFAKLMELFEGTAAHATLAEMEQELGPIRSWDLVSRLITMADEIATQWQKAVQKDN